MMMNILHVSVNHFVFSLEECLFISSAHFFDVIICFVSVEFEEFFIDLGYQPFVCSVTCEYLLPFHGLPLCFVDFGHSHWCKVVSQCGFDLNLPDSMMTNIFSCVC